MNSLKEVIKELMPNLAVSEQNWINYFEQNPKLREVFLENDISKEIIITSFNQLYQYIEEQNSCDKCKSINSCPNLLKGHYTILHYQDNHFQTSLYKCNKQRIEEESEYRKDLFKSQYIPQEILDASFKDIDITPNRKNAITALMEFCKNYNQSTKTKGIYIYGSLGVGKSHMMSAAAKKLAERNIPTMMVYMPDFFREMKSSIQDQTLNEKIEVLKNVEILILDDIGAETISQWERDEILGAILQARMVKGLPTLYTSNYNYNDLEEHLSYSTKGGVEELKAKRLMERIRHYTVSYFVDGPNLRITE